MSLASVAGRLFAPLIAAGAFTKLRTAKPGMASVLKSAARRSSTDRKVEPGSRIVVVGIGPAALACLRELRAANFADVTVVARDDLFGGKCLNIGCMPIEFVLNSPAPVDAQAIRQFTAGLRADAEAAFRELGYPIVQATAEKVSGSSLHLSDGQALHFDRLVLATGSRFAVPEMLSQVPGLCGIEEFWSLPTGSRVTILAEANAAAVALGEVALRMGMAPTVLLSGVNPMFGLPSYRYFLARLRDRGVIVHEKAGLRRAGAGSLEITAGRKHIEIGHDYVVAAGNPQPDFLEIDGESPGLFDLDLTRASLPSRPDVCFLGDGGGMLTSTEAALQARLLVREWQSGERMDLRSLGHMPLVIHGSSPWAAVGPEWSLFERKWREIDFRQLGWSRISQTEGKLWYVASAQGDRIEAIHICHPGAPELIAAAAALRGHGVNDIAWLQCATHPSAAEIFPLVADHARAMAPPAPATAIAPEAGEVQEFRSPDVTGIDSDSLPAWLDHDMWHRVVLSRHPGQLLAVYFGLHCLERASGDPIGRDIVCADADNWAVAGDDETAIAFTSDRTRCEIRKGASAICIRMA